MTEEEHRTEGKPSEEKTPQVRLFTGVFISIIGIALCCFTASQGLNAGTSVYIDRLGGSATLAGIGAAVFSGAALIARLFAGSLADSRGRFAMMLGGVITLLVGILGAGLTANLELIMIWRVLQGLGFSFCTTAAATAAADVLPAERLGEGIGYYGLGQAIAMSIGPALAIALVSTDPAENLFWGLAIAASLGVVLCLFCRYEKHPERLPKTSTYRRLREDKENEPSDKQPDASKRGGFASSILEPGALAGGIPMMFLSPAFGFGIFFVGLFGTQLGVGNAGLFYTLSAVSMIVVRLSSRAFMDHVLPIRLFAVAVAAGLVCYAMLLAVSLGFVEGIGLDAVFYAAGIFYGICMGVAMPVNQTVAVKNSPAERWGAANGLFMLLFDVGIGLASVVWGITNDQLGFPITICCVLALIAISFVAALFSYPASAKRS